MWRVGLKVLLFVLALALGTGAWFAFTESGARVAVTYVSGVVPNFKARYADGTLAGPLHLRTVVVKTRKLRLEADDLVLDWSPSCLLIAELCIGDAKLGSLTLDFAQPATPPPPSTQPRRLPAIDLPVDIDVEHLAIAQLDIVRGDKRTRYTGIEAVLAWQDADMRIDRLVIGMPGWEATAAGTIATRDDWPLSATLAFRMPRGGEPVFALEGAAGGSLSDTRLALTSRGLIAARIDGRMSPLASGIPFSATLAADSLRVPPSGAPEKSASIEAIALTAHGELLGQLAIDGRGRIDTPWTPPLAATLASTGTWRGLENATLRIDDPRLVAEVDSDYRWLGGQHFAAGVAVHHLDLSLVNPAVASRLAGRLRVDGDIDKTGTVVRIDVESLEGTLRQWPLAITGPLRWQDAQWHFDDLRVAMGNNTARISGTLGDAWRADAALVLDDLATLQPAFAGTATGSATIAGAPTAPQFRFTLDARDLLLPAVSLPLPGEATPRSVRLPAHDWQVSGIATLDDVTLTDAHTVAPATDAATPGPFAAQATGNVGWKGPLRWDLDTRVAGLHLHDLLPELGGTVSGPLATQGVLGATLEALAVDTRLDGELDGLPLHVDAAFRQDGRGTEVERLAVAHGENRLAGNGSLDPQRLSLDIDVRAPDLAASFRELAGGLRLAARADGTRLAPDIDLDLAAHDLAWRDLQLAGLEARARIVDGGRGDSLLGAALQGLKRGQDSLSAARLDARGTRESHRIEVSAAAAPLAVDLALAGGFPRVAGNAPAFTHWSGRLQAGGIDIDAWHWTAMGEPAVALDDASVALDPHCWSDGSARACLTAPALLGASGHLQGEVFHLPLEDLLGGLLPLDTVVTGRIGGTLAARWQDGEVQSLSASLQNADPLHLALAGDAVDDSRDIGVLDTLLVQADGDEHGLAASAVLNGETTGSVGALVYLSPLADANAALDGTVHVAGLRLGLAEAFTYQLRDIGGTLDGTLNLGGTLAAPRLAGHLALNEGRLAFTRLPLSLVDIQLDSAFDGNQVRLDGTFRTPDAGAPARVTARATLANGTWQGTGALTGESLVVGNLPEYQFTVAPDLVLAADPSRLALGGTVRVPAGRIELKALPAQSVSLSRDVVVVQHQAAGTVEQGGLVINQDVDVDFVLGDDIGFRAFGGEGRLTGNLRVRSRPQVPLWVDGELHVKDGKYTALGQSLSLKTADIIFNGPADAPLVDALAVRTINDAAVREVGLRLSGNLRTPQTTLYSNPALPDEQALVWLTTGRAPAEGPVNLRGEAANAAMSLGVAQGSALLTAAGKEIGLQDVQLATTGQGDEAEVQVGTNLNERIFVGYNRRVFTGDESVMVRLQMTRRLMLEALSGLESAVDIFYTFEF